MKGSQQHAISLALAREVDSRTNVLVAEPFDPVVYERTTKRDGLTLAAPTPVSRRPPHRLWPNAI